MREQSKKILEQKSKFKNNNNNIIKFNLSENNVSVARGDNKKSK
jgi:hypothetical protein